MMNNIFKSLVLTVGFLIMAACQHHSNRQHSKQINQPVQRQKIELAQQNLTQLVQLMSGQFDSLHQSQQNDSYFHISLKMKPIWQHQKEGRWLYVEQAVGTMMDKPYRQRIYHVTALDEGTYSSAVFELPDPKAVIGAYEKPELLADLAVEDLNLRTGCAVILNKVDNNQFQGSTDEKKCLSQLRGASYATSKVVINEAGITSWDQGFDANDKQVWGAISGPYVFDRK